MTQHPPQSLSVPSSTTTGPIWEKPPHIPEHLWESAYDVADSHSHLYGCNEQARYALTQDIAGALIQVAADEVEISIKPMKLSDGRCDYFVSFRCGGREVTPHVFREQFKAEYHVALYRWLFGQGAKPDLMAFDEGEWPAREYTAEEQAAFAAIARAEVQP